MLAHRRRSAKFIPIIILTLISFNLFFSVTLTPVSAQTSSGNNAFIGEWVNKAQIARIVKAIISNGQTSTFSVALFGDGNSTAQNYPPADANPDGPTIYGHTLCATDNFGRASYLQFAITLSQDSSYLTAAFDYYQCENIPIIGSIRGITPFQSLPDPRYNNFRYVTSWTDVLVKPTTGTNQGTCNLTGITFSSQTSRVFLEQESSSSAILNVNYTTTDFRALEVVLSAQLVSSPVSYDPSQHQLGYEFEKDIFGINPNQVVAIPMTFTATQSLPVGEYSYKISLDAKNGQCHVNPAFLTLPITVKQFVPKPDFTIKSIPANLTLYRGYSQDASIIMDAFPATKGSLHVSLSTKWGKDFPDPILLEPTLDNSNAFLYPGATVLDTFTLNAKLNDTNAGQSDYIGQFMLTIMATGVWTENGIEYPVVHQVDVPITIKDKPTDFLLVSNATNISLMRTGTAVKLEVNLLDGPPRPVSLNVVGYYPDLIIKTEKNGGIPDFSSLLTVIPTQPFNGTRQIQVVATGGGNTHTLTLALAMAQSKAGSQPVPPPSAPSVTITIDSEPRLDGLILDNSTIPGKNLQYQNSWHAGESHRLEAMPQIQIDQGKRYVFDGWSDGEKSPVRTIEVSNLATTIVGKYRTQYYFEIKSPYGEPMGSGWYDEGSMANFSVLRLIPEGFGVNRAFDGWSGDSILIGQACPGVNATNVSGTSASLHPDRVAGTICMNAAHTLIPVWKLDSSFQMSVLGGGLSAASIGGAVAVLAKTGHLSNLLKGKRPKIPILSWEIYSPLYVIGKAPVYIDIILKNVGEADAKNIRVEVVSEDLEYPPPYLIETLMPWESRRISFSADPKRETSSYELKVTLQSKYIPKKEVMAVIAGTEIKYVPRKERLISLAAKDVRVCIFAPDVNSRINLLVDQLSGRGFTVEKYNQTAPIDELTRQFDVLVLPLTTDISRNDVSALRNFVKSGNGLVLFGSTHGKRNTSSGMLADLLQILGCEVEVDSELDYERAFSFRVSDSEHPITRGLDAGDVFRARGGGGILLRLRQIAGRVLMEQWVNVRTGSGNDVATVPAVIAKDNLDETGGIQKSGGRTAFLNIDSDSSILSEIMARSILWAAGALNEKPQESD